MVDERTPEGSRPAAEEFRRKVDEVLDRMRPYLRMDGGEIELVDVNEAEGLVVVRLQGACHG